jgi:hypothetical protein
VLHRPAVDLFNVSRVNIASSLAFLLLHWRKFYTRSVRQPFDRPHKAQPLAHLNEFDYIAPRAARKALKYLLIGMNKHTWLVVIVKRTKPNHLSALADEIDMFRYNVNYIVGSLNAGYYAVVYFHLGEISIKSKFKNKKSKMRNPP